MAKSRGCAYVGHSLAGIFGIFKIENTTSIYLRCILWPALSRVPPACPARPGAFQYTGEGGNRTPVLPSCKPASGVLHGPLPLCLPSRRRADFSGCSRYHYFPPSVSKTLPRFRALPQVGEQSHRWADVCRFRGRSKTCLRHAGAFIAPYG